jgi:hypothetical protein
MGAITSLLVEAHARLHDCFDKRAFFDHALANLGAVAGRGNGWLFQMLWQWSPAGNALANPGFGF